MTDQFKAFIKNYWNYYRELEDELIQTKRYVDFHENNYKTFSVEYLKLYQAVCSEIDVLGKALASFHNANFRAEDKKNNIYKWWYEIQDCKIKVKNIIDNTETEIPLDEFTCTFMDDYDIVPWKGFGIRHEADSTGRMQYHLGRGKSTPAWWTSYNAVKHNRTLKPRNANEINYTLANLGNLIKAFAGLYVLERYQMQVAGSDEDLQAFADHSQLFWKASFLTNKEFDRMLDAMDAADENRSGEQGEQ